METESEQWRIIREYHEGTGNSIEARAINGHFGRVKTLALIQSKCYFPSISKKIEDYIRSCVACQHVKCGGKFEKGGEKLKSIPVPRLQWKQLGIDCITNLPSVLSTFLPGTVTVYHLISNNSLVHQLEQPFVVETSHPFTVLWPTDEGYDTIVTAIDYTSKWPECKAFKGKFTDGVKEFMYELVCHHRAAKLHISNQGRAFVNQVCVNSCSYTMYMYIFSLVYERDDN